MKHYVVTQWNCDLYDLGWLQRRQKVFEKFCLPSVESQSNKDFEWLIVSDSRTPDKFKNVLDAYPATVIYPDFENYDWTANGAESNSRHTTDMTRAIRLEHIKGVLVDHIGVQDTDYVITSRLDNDDAIAIDHVARIQRAAHSYRTLNPEQERYWVSLVRGRKWNNGKVYPHNSTRNPFISYVEPPDDLQTTYQVCHTEAGKTGDPIYAERSGEPTWLQVIHGETLLNRLKRFKGEEDDTVIRDRFVCNW